MLSTALVRLDLFFLLIFFAGLGFSLQPFANMCSKYNYTEHFSVYETMFHGDIDKLFSHIFSLDNFSGDQMWNLLWIYS